MAFNGTNVKDFPHVSTNRTEPEIHPNVDGYLLICSNSRTMYLKWWDGLRYKLGLTTVKELEQKYLSADEERVRKAKLRNKFMRL